MYGGLFGDLPAAKNAPKDDSVDGRSHEHSLPCKPQNACTKPASSDTIKPSVSNPAKQKKSFGVGETTTSFVPLAVRNKRKNLPPATSTTGPAPASGVSGQSFRTTSNPSHFTIADPLNPSTTVIYTHRSERSSVTESDKEVNNAGGDPASPDIPAAQSEIYEPSHALIEDPYDPMVPNDLLQYWQKKNFEKQRINLEKERQAALQHQEAMRERLQQERRELALAGDVEKLTKRSMGRGRGISNLPAWLLEKEKQAATGPSDGTSSNL